MWPETKRTRNGRRERNDNDRALKGWSLKSSLPVTSKLSFYESQATSESRNQQKKLESEASTMVVDEAIKRPYS